MAIATGQYKTRPMESWDRLRELKRKFLGDMWTAHDRGELLVMGGFLRLNALPAGLGDYHLFGGMGPNFARIAEDRQLLGRCIEATETMGYGLDVCSTLLATLGAWKLGIFDVSPSGERVKPDFMIDVMTCQSLAKTGQIWAERYGVPSFIIEFVPTPNCSEYLVSQMSDAIEWMEKVTGRKYQDDLLIQAVRNEWHVRMLWSQIIELQKAIPAPLDARQLFSLASPMWRGGLHRKELVEVYRMVLDEMRERVRDKIAALGTERCRLMHEGIWTWYDTDIAKYPRKYGATFVGSDSMFCAEGVYEVGEDGSYKIGPTLEGRGLELRTREDALQALAELYTRWNPTPSGYYLDNRIKRGVKAAEDWHADAVVINFDQGCKGMTAGLTEMALALKKKGIPTLFYQANAANPTDFDEGEYQSRMDAFLESLGLRPLE